MEDSPGTGTKKNKWLKLLLKIAVTVVCLWYISGKIDFTKAWAAVKTANWSYLLLALVAFIVSKLISAVRLNIYFNNIGLRLSHWQNIKLYWLGMFYNLFLPGSISGDAYKVILLKKRYHSSYKKTSAAVLLDRFSGLLGLGLILGVYGIFVIDRQLYAVTIAGGSVVAVALFYFIVSRWMSEFLQSFFLALLLGILVQTLQVICAYLIMASLGIPAHITEYIFIFLLSSIAAVIPLTVGGGLGIREVVFIEGAKLFGLVRDTSFVIGSFFYLITLTVSAVGIFYVFKDPLTKKS